VGVGGWGWVYKMSCIRTESYRGVHCTQLLHRHLTHVYIVCARHVSGYTHRYSHAGSCGPLRLLRLNNCVLACHVSKPTTKSTSILIPIHARTRVYTHTHTRTHTQAAVGPCVCSAFTTACMRATSANPSPSPPAFSYPYTRVHVSTHTHRQLWAPASAPPLQLRVCVPRQ